MAEVRWTPEATAWLESIYEYIAQDSDEAAGRVVQGICDKAESLIVFPQRGSLNARTPRGEVRVILYGHYRIAYLYADEVVHILGIYHAALDMDRFMP